MRQAIGDFLLRRLQEVGIKHIFGVPGGPLKLEMIPSEQENLKACTGMILKRLPSANTTSL